MKIQYSDIDVLNKLTCEACIPEIGFKTRLWDSYVEGKLLN